MPIMNAMFLDSDPDGAELLRAVLETGRRGRRRKINDILGVRDLRMAGCRADHGRDRRDRRRDAPGRLRRRRGGVA